MDYGDIIRLIVFGFIFLSFFSGLFGRGKKDDEKQSKQRQANPARPTELDESGGPTRSRPVVIADPAGPVTVFAGEETRRAEPRREERPRPPLERDVRDTERQMLEQDLTDMPTISEELDPERHPRRRRRQQEVRRQRRIVEGGDVLRRSLKDPATLERAFIVKEVLDRPLALRDDR